MRDHEYFFEKVILGHSERALLYGYLNNLPVIVNNKQELFPFEFFDPSIDCSKILWDNKLEEVKMPTETFTVGSSIEDVKNHLKFVMSLGGLLPFAHMISAIRIEGKNLDIITENRTLKVVFEELIVFDDENVSGLPDPATTTAVKYRVADWINFKSIVNHPYSALKLENDYGIDIVWFHRASDKATFLKDAVIVSTLTEEQLHDMNYNDTSLRLFLREEMRAMGFGDRAQRKLLHVFPFEREIKKIQKKTYVDEDNLTFNNMTFEQIMEEYDVVPSYSSYLMEKLHVR